MRIAGSLWSVPPDDQQARLESAVTAGLSAVHWDSADGRFARKGGFSSQKASQLVNSAPPIESEAHLMLSDPLQAIDAWAEFCSLIVVPIEISDPWSALRRIESRGARAGLAVSLETPLHTVPETSIPILVMAITPGRAGDPFADTARTRIRACRARGCHELVGVDGGVGPSQFEPLGEAGVTWVVSGGSLFDAADPRAWIERCQHQVGGPDLPTSA